jgi:hypothetical protein
MSSRGVPEGGNARATDVAHNLRRESNGQANFYLNRP